MLWKPMANWVVYSLGRQCKSGTSMRRKASDELGRPFSGGPLATWVVCALGPECKTGTSMLWEASDELERLCSRAWSVHAEKGQW